MNLHDLINSVSVRTDSNIFILLLSIITAQINILVKSQRNYARENKNLNFMSVMFRYDLTDNITLFLNDRFYFSKQPMKNKPLNNHNTTLEVWTIIIFQYWADNNSRQEIG